MSSRISLFYEIEYFRDDLACEFTVPMMKPAVIEQLLGLYSNLSLKVREDNREQIEYVQFRILLIAYYALGVYELKLDENSEYELLRPNVFYENKIGVIRLLLSLANGEIIKIQLLYALAFSLYSKTAYDEKRIFECYGKRTLYCRN